jgi:SAM-dependent methyltransferase
MKILDVGVGTGKGALALASSGARVVGLDYTGAMLHIARKKAVEAQLDQVQFLRGNGNQLPFGDAEFDAVISLNFLHLFTPVSNQRVFTNEMHRVLRPGGKLVVELVNLYQGLFLGLARRQFTHDLGFNKPGDIQTLLSPQFEVLRVQGGYFPAMWRVLYPLSKLSLGASRSIEGIAHYWPWKYLAYNVFVEAIRS